MARPRIDTETGQLMSEVVHMRLTETSMARVDEIARLYYGSNRSDALRTLIGLGLHAWDTSLPPVLRTNGST